MPSTRAINRALWSIAAGAGAGAVVTIAVGVIVQPRVGDALSSRQATAASPETRPTASTRDPALLERAWSAPVRQPLTDTQLARTRPAQSTATSDAPPMTLVGTVGNSLALLRNPTGEVVVAAVGEETSGIKIVSVRPWQIDVQYRGRALTMHKPRPEDEVRP